MFKIYKTLIHPIAIVYSFIVIGIAKLKDRKASIFQGYSRFLLYIQEYFLFLKKHHKNK